MSVQLSQRIIRSIPTVQRPSVHPLSKVLKHLLRNRLANHSQILLAHLSRRLTRELIGYPWIRCSSVVVHLSVVRPFIFSNVFSSETAWPIKTKFYVEPPWEGRTKVDINGPGHMIKMVAMPIYGKKLEKSSALTLAGRFPRNLVCSIGDSCPSLFV